MVTSDKHEQMRKPPFARNIQIQFDYEDNKDDYLLNSMGFHY